MQDSSDVIKEGRVRVVFNIPQEPQLEMLIQNQHVRNLVCMLVCVELRVDLHQLPSSVCVCLCVCLL